MPAPHQILRAMPLSSRAEKIISPSTVSRVSNRRKGWSKKILFLTVTQPSHNSIRTLSSFSSYLSERCLTPHSEDNIMSVWIYLCCYNLSGV